MLEHGGRLRAAAERYRIPLADWVDLSTGINPRAYPVPPLSPEVWQRLPEAGDGLEAAAAAYYGSAGLLPVAGSQAAIQALPACFAPGRVVTLAPTYAEHPHAWRKHQVRALPAAAIADAVDSADTLLLVQPNNPDAQRFPRGLLLAWRERLAARASWAELRPLLQDDQAAWSVAEAVVVGDVDALLGRRARRRPNDDRNRRISRHRVLRSRLGHGAKRAHVAPYFLGEFSCDRHRWGAVRNELQRGPRRDLSRRKRKVSHHPRAHLGRVGRQHERRPPGRGRRRRHRRLRTRSRRGRIGARRLSGRRNRQEPV